MLMGPHELEALVALRKERLEQETAHWHRVHEVAFGPPWWRRRLGSVLHALGAILMRLGERLAMDGGNLA